MLLFRHRIIETIGGLNMSETVKGNMPAGVDEEFEIYKEETLKLIDEVKIIHGVLAKRYEIEELAKEKKERAKKEGDDESKNTKSNEQIIEILQRLEETSEVNVRQSETREEKFKVPSLRFQEIEKTKYADISSELKDKYDKIKEVYGYEVRLVEDIDIKSVNADKFYILIKDRNGNSTTIDLIKYQTNIYDYTVDEEAEIKDVLMRLSGTYTKEIIDASKLIADYISLCLGYKQEFFYKYRFIGWDIIDGNTIFKYDRIFSNHIPAYKGFCGEEWADAIAPRFVSSDKKEDLFIWAKMMQQVFGCNADKDKSKVDIVLCAGASGVLRQALTFSKETNINMNIVAGKGSGKSTLQHLVLSFFGDPAALEGSFVDTENASAKLRALRSVIPYMLDERMLRVEGDSDEKKSRQLLIDIFKEYEGKIKETANGGESGLRSYGGIISSSVQSVFEAIDKGAKIRKEKLGDKLTDIDLGQYRRFIELYLDKEDIFNDVIIINDDKKEEIISASEQAKAADNLAYNRYGYGVALMVSYMLKMMKYHKVYEYLLEEENELNVSMIMNIGDWAISGKSDCVPAEFGFISADIIEKTLNIVENSCDESETGDIGIFDALFVSMQQDVKKVIANYKEKKVIDELESSVQRFSLIALTGYILNYSIGDEEVGYISMDIEGMISQLVNNLYQKLVVARVIVPTEVKIAEEKESREKLLESQKIVVKLLDWLRTNKKYFYIVKGADKNDLVDSQYILKYEEKGGKVTINIPYGKGRTLTIDDILGHLNLDGGLFLEYEYNKKTLRDRTSNITIEDITDRCSECIKFVKKEFVKTGYERGDIYAIDVNEVELLREKINNSTAEKEVSSDEVN